MPNTIAVRLISLNVWNPVCLHPNHLGQELNRQVLSNFAMSFSKDRVSHGFTASSSHEYLSRIAFCCVNGLSIRCIASEVVVYPEFVNLLQEIVKHFHVAAVVVSSGLCRIWEKALEPHGLFKKAKVVGGDRIRGIAYYDTKVERPIGHSSAA